MHNESIIPHPYLSTILVISNIDFIYYFYLIDKDYEKLVAIDNNRMLFSKSISTIDISKFTYYIQNLQISF